MRFRGIVLIAVLILGAVAAVAQIYDEDNIYGYSGQAGRDRRLIDPFSREQYFGVGYVKPYESYGRKGPNNNRYLGAKGTGSAAFNFDTNSYTPQGRNPGRISNFDPNMRGFTRRDVSVNLLPYEHFLTSLDGPRITRGTARILSLGGTTYGAGRNKPMPSGQVYVQLRDLPPLQSDELYSVWLGDEDAGYELQIGLLNTVGFKGTGQLLFEITRLLTPYDYVMVTKEPFPDPDPRPGEIVLIGTIPQEREKLGHTTLSLALR